MPKAVLLQHPPDVVAERPLIAAGQSHEPHFKALANSNARQLTNAFFSHPGASCLLLCAPTDGVLLAVGGHAVCKKIAPAALGQPGQTPAPNGGENHRRRIGRHQAGGVNGAHGSDLGLSQKRFADGSELVYLVGSAEREAARQVVVLLLAAPANHQVRSGRVINDADDRGMGVERGSRAAVGSGIGAQAHDAFGVDRAHGSGLRRLDFGGAAQNRPINVGAQLFAAHRPGGGSLDSWAVFGRHAAALAPHAWQTASDLDLGCQSRDSPGRTYGAVKG